MGSLVDRPGVRNSAEVPRLGRYRVCYRIAQGGMASVYLARLDTTAGFSKWVALKIIHPNIAADEKFVVMFLDEARLAARLDHPNLCTVFDFGEDDGTYFIAMEYLHGETLGAMARKAWSSQGALPFELGVRVVADAARGLHAAHELRADDGTPANVVHRDVSPENVFVTYTGTAKVVDFGVARSSEQAHERTATGELKGKLAYMSPEQLHEKRVDRRADVWALGVVLWEITVGRRLFRRQTDAQTVFAITRDPITLPSRLRDDYPAVLEAIVMKALERDVDQRYQTAQELCRALETWLNSTGTHTGVGELAEFMELLFAEQMVWRERYLRHPEEPFEDLVHSWQSAPARGSHEPDEPKTQQKRAPFGSPSMLPDEDPATAERRIDSVTPRIPRRIDSPESTARSIAARIDAPEESEVIPLTRRTLTPPPRAAATPPISRPPDLEVTAPRQDSPSTLPLPPRRQRWGDVITVLALMVMGGVMAHIWFDRPTPRPMRRPGAPAVTPQPHRAPSTPRVEPHRPASVTTPVPYVGDASIVVNRGRSPGRRGATPEVAEEDRATPGLLRLTANAPSEVYVGSRLLGRTPIAAMEMSPGVYALRVVPLWGGGERQVMVTMRAGETSEATVEWPAEQSAP